MPLSFGDHPVHGFVLIKIERISIYDLLIDFYLDWNGYSFGFHLLSLSE
jgi:hypothetical protein